MLPRDPNEPHRVASTLELFFDLVFVIAVSTLSSVAHHNIDHMPPWQAAVMYLLAFEFIWWAWTNVTWFASSFGADDWLYRVLTFLQMIGVLVLAAGIDPLFTHMDTRLSALGYVIMRLALVPQWVRAWKVSAKHTRNAAELAHIQTATAIYAVGVYFWPDVAANCHPAYVGCGRVVCADVR